MRWPRDAGRAGAARIQVVVRTMQAEPRARAHAVANGSERGSVGVRAERGASGEWRGALSSPGSHTSLGYWPLQLASTPRHLTTVDTC